MNVRLMGPLMRWGMPCVVSEKEKEAAARREKPKTIGACGARGEECR